MPANTPRGYPYPLPVEPVAEGAQAIRNLADALDAKVGLRPHPDAPADGRRRLHFFRHPSDLLSPDARALWALERRRLQ